jgi:hypothetical protein
MNSEYFESLARLTPALPDTDCDFSARGGHWALRAEAVRQSCWVQRAWTRTRTAHLAGVSGRIVPTARARRADETDVLRQMGEDVPSWFDESGSRMWSIDAASSTTSVSLAALLADITRVPARFGADAAGAGDDRSAKERP